MWFFIAAWFRLGFKWHLSRCRSKMISLCRSFVAPGGYRPAGCERVTTSQDLPRSLYLSFSAWFLTSSTRIKLIKSHLPQMHPPPEETPFPETYLTFSIPAWERWSENLDLTNSLGSETTQCSEWTISSELDLFCESVCKKTFGVIQSWVIHISHYFNRWHFWNKMYWKYDHRNELHFN